MTPDLKYLLLSTILCFVQVLIAASGANSQVGLNSLAGNRDSLPAITGWAGRAKRAHLNMVENLVLFAALVLIAAYDQNRTDGPPFSVPEAEVRDLFEPYATVEGRGRFDVTAATKNLTEKGVTKVEETVYLLVRNDRSIEGRP